MVHFVYKIKQVINLNIYIQLFLFRIQNIALNKNNGSSVSLNM